MTKTIDDKRPIKRIHFPDGGSIGVNRQCIEKIEPYHENGQMAPILWFAIYKKGKIFQRLNSAHIEGIEY